MNRFDNITKPLMWFMALLLTAFIAGCGGGSSSSTPVPSLLNSAKSIDTFSLAWANRAPGGTATGTVDQTMKTITVPVPHRANITQLFATFTTSPGVTVTIGTAPAPVVTQVSGSTQNDYTNPVSYQVTAADGTRATYTVIVNRDQTMTSLAVTPATATTPKGATQQFAANATYFNALIDNVTTIDDVTATASWTSAASGVASVGLHTGLATGVTVSTTPVVITAAVRGQTDTAAMTVTDAALMSLAITPASGVVAVGSTLQFAATGTYTDGSHPPVTATASWTSAASGVASVGSFDTAGTPGLATGVTASTTPVVITATIIDSVYGSVSGTADLTVTAPLAPNLRRTANFAVLAGDITNNALATTINGGDVGAATISANPTVNGGVIYTTGAPTYDNAMIDLPFVIADANDAGLFPCGTSTSGGMGTVTMTPGIHCLTGNVSGVVILTLDGPGVYIFRTTGSLAPAANSSVVFGVGSGADNTNTSVFWVVGDSSLGSPATFVGTILSAGGITLGDGDTLVNGRVLTTARATLTNNTNITRP